MRTVKTAITTPAKVTLWWVGGAVVSLTKGTFPVLHDAFYIATACAYDETSPSPRIYRDNRHNREHIIQRFNQACFPKSAATKQGVD